MTTSLDNIFGPERTWLDVQDVTAKRLRRKVPSASAYEIEDAVGFALVDLVDYWVNLTGSVDPTNPEKTFWYAVRRATWTAGEYLSGELSDRHGAQEQAGELSSRIVSVDALEELAKHAGYEHSTPVEDEALDNIERARFDAYLSDQDDEWLHLYLSGASQADVAQTEGCSKQAVSKRWQRAFRSFVSMAQADLGVA